MKKQITDTANFRESLLLQGQQTEGVHFVGGIGIIVDSRKIDSRYWTRINQVYRTRDWQLSYIRKGVCRNKLNLLDDVATDGDLQIIPPGVLVMPLPNEPTLHLSVVSVNNEALLHTYKQKQPVTISLNESQRMVVEQYLLLLGSLATQEEIGEQNVAGVVDSMLGYALGLSSSTPDESANQTRHELLFRRFHRLLTQHGAREHKIAFYADQLAITPNYLNTIIKKVSGQTITEWINQLLISEAKAALAFSDMSIADITDALHFANAPFFCKFFKNHTGMRPSEYRQKGRNE